MKIASKQTAPRRGGRPSRADAERLRDTILDAATALFFAEGYGATSIEAIAAKAKISKRTFYHRFKDKADLFQAVVHHLIERLRPPNTPALFEGAPLEEILLRIARLILHAALTPASLSLHRIMQAEAERFPELVLISNRIGARQEAVERIAGLLRREMPKISTPELATFAAEQFLQMIVGFPQRCALGLGTPLTQPQLDEWAQNTVKLFLNGCA